MLALRPVSSSLVVLGYIWLLLSLSSFELSFGPAPTLFVHLTLPAHLKSDKTIYMQHRSTGNGVGLATYTCKCRTRQRYQITYQLQEANTRYGMLVMMIRLPYSVEATGGLYYV
jgi:hypothetical protein